MSKEGQQQNASLSVLFVGDVMLGRLMNEVLQEHGPAYPWGDTRALFRGADVRLCNLECVLCDQATPRPAMPKAFRFRSDVQHVKALTEARIDAVSLANNHVLDFGVQGLFQMIHVLREAGIHQAGAGATLREASAPAIWKVKGVTIGFLAFTDNEPGWAATEEQPGVWYVPIALHAHRAQRLFTMVERTSKVVDLLVVSVHWGPNWGETPPAEHHAFAHALIDAGADLIFGHSGHVMRGIEIYQKKLILYCAGDFLDDYAVDEHERNDRGALFVVERVGSAFTHLFLYPTVIQSFQAQRAQRDERGAIVAMMQRLCTSFHTASTWNEHEDRLEIALS